MGRCSVSSLPSQHTFTGALKGGEMFRLGDFSESCHPSSQTSPALFPTTFGVNRLNHKCWCISNSCCNPGRHRRHNYSKVEGGSETQDLQRAMLTLRKKLSKNLNITNMIFENGETITFITVSLAMFMLSDFPDIQQLQQRKEPALSFFLNKGLWELYRLI